MRRTKTSWLTLILMLFALAAPITARADFWAYYLGGGGDAGDPDNPTGKLAPSERAGRVGGNDSRYQTQRPLRSDSWFMRRYLTLLSGLRSYYLRF
jgi:hypothetical protein